MDGMFVVLGRQIVGDIIQAPYCHHNRDKNCTANDYNIDMDYGGKSLALWIQRVGNPYTVPKNDVISHFSSSD